MKVTVERTVDVGVLNAILLASYNEIKALDSIQEKVDMMKNLLKQCIHLLLYYKREEIKKM